MKFELLELLSPFGWTIVGLSLFLWIVRLLYVAYLSPLRLPAKERVEATPGITVVVYACNDAENIRQNLTAILDQEYPEFDVVVVNDGSTDETNMELTQLEARYPNLYHTYLPEAAKTMIRRKMAMIVGLKAVRREWVLLTTANSLPDSPRWLAAMAAEMRPETDLVLGYSGIVSPSGNGAWYTLQNLFFQLRYLSVAHQGTAYMGVGNNLAIRHAALTPNIMSGTLHIKAGEDDITVNRLARKGNCRVALSADASVRVAFDKLSEGWSERRAKYGLTRRYYTRHTYRFWWGESVAHALLLTLWGAALYLYLVSEESTPLVTTTLLALLGTLVSFQMVRPVIGKFEPPLSLWSWFGRELLLSLLDFWNALLGRKG